jgi:hypothetical protein
MSLSAVNASMNNQYYMNYQKEQAHKATATKAAPKHATAPSNTKIDLKA